MICSVSTQVEGFSEKDYCVMQRSCNTFTEAFASRLTIHYHVEPLLRLGLLDHFPAAVHQQSRLGQVIFNIDNSQ